MTSALFKLSGLLLFILLFLIGVCSTRPVQAVVAHALHKDRELLLGSITAGETIDAAKFWEWRDRTYGTFTFDPTTTFAGMNRRIAKPTSTFWKLHTFSSPTIQSSEDSLYYSEAPVLQLLTELSKDFSIENYTKLRQGTDFTIWQANNSAAIHLVFLKDATELQKVDGLFDFIGSEPSYLEHAYWLNTTVLKL